jgi:hypothetical protein
MRKITPFWTKKLAEILGLSSVSAPAPRSFPASIRLAHNGTILALRIYFRSKEERSADSMFMIRGFVVWLAIVFAESVSGTIRRIFLEPAIGDFPARRAGFFVGMLLIFLVAVLLIRWIGAPNLISLYWIGLMWMLLTAGFEVGLGVLLGYTRERIVEDYDPSRGGLMAIGLLYMVFVPHLAAAVRARMGATLRET